MSTGTNLSVILGVVVILLISVVGLTIIPFEITSQTSESDDTDLISESTNTDLSNVDPWMNTETPDDADVWEHTETLPESNLEVTYNVTSESGSYYTDFLYLYDYEVTVTSLDNPEFTKTIDDGFSAQTERSYLPEDHEVSDTITIGDADNAESHYETTVNVAFTYELTGVEEAATTDTELTINAEQLTSEAEQFTDEDAGVYSEPFTVSSENTTFVTTDDEFTITFDSVKSNNKGSLVITDNVNGDSTQTDVREGVTTNVLLLNRVVEISDVDVVQENDEISGVITYDIPDANGNGNDGAGGVLAFIWVVTGVIAVFLGVVWGVKEL